VDLVPLNRPTGPCRRAPDPPGASGARRRLRRRGQRRSRPLAPATLAAERLRPGRARHHLGHLDPGGQAPKPGSTTRDHPRHAEPLRFNPSPPGQDRPGARSALGVPRPPDAVEPTNNGSERLLRPSVIERKVTNCYRAMWAAEGEAANRTIVDTARLTGGTPFGTILKPFSA